MLHRGPAVEGQRLVVDHPPLRDLDDHRPARALLVEGERLGAAGIEEAGDRVDAAAVVVPAERRGEATPGDALGLEGAVQRLAGRAPAELGAVEEREVDPGADLRPLERVAAPRRVAMGEPPEAQAVGEGDRLERRAGEEVHVRRPADALVQAAREQRVVVAGGEVDAHRLPGGEGVAEEAAGVEPGVLVLVEVAADGDRVAAVLAGRLAGAPQRVAEPLTAAARHLSEAAHAGEGAVQVEVGDVEQAEGHGASVTERHGRGATANKGSRSRLPRSPGGAPEGAFEAPRSSRGGGDARLLASVRCLCSAEESAHPGPQGAGEPPVHPGGREGNDDRGGE